MKATNIYGIAIKYIIPLFTPFACDGSESDSKTALHMAHCASSETTLSNSKIRMMYFVFITRNRVKSLSRQ